MSTHNHNGVITFRCLIRTCRMTITPLGDNSNCVDFGNQKSPTALWHRGVYQDQWTCGRALVVASTRGLGLP